MTLPKGFNPMAGAELLNAATDPDLQAENECRTIGDTHYCVGQSLSLGYVGEAHGNDTGIGLVFVNRRGGGVGLSVALTPKAMRGLSAALLQMADLVDTAAAQQARSALARAAGK